MVIGLSDYPTADSPFTLVVVTIARPSPRVWTRYWFDPSKKNKGDQRAGDYETAQKTAGSQFRHQSPWVIHAEPIQTRMSP